MMALSRRFKPKNPTKGGKGGEQAKAEQARTEEEAKKRQEEAQKLEQEAAEWLQKGEEEKRKAAQEAAEKAQEAAKEAEEAARLEAEEAKRRLDEELQKQEAEKIKLTQQSASETPTGQSQEEENPKVQILQVTTTSTPVTPMLQLVPFVQKKGEEVPDFSTVYYDRATKRIMRRTEKKVEAKDLSGKMVTDTAVMLGTDKDPMLTIRAGAALIDASADNIKKVMFELESAKKTTTQLKDTLR